jgi:ABC-type uncharacterized transport system permease subunit
MKLMEFKNAFLERLILLRINIVNTFYEDYANFANNWASLLSTTFYTIAFMTFIQVIFSNVTLFAGYSKNDILLMSFIGQVNAFSIFSWSVHNIERFIKDVNAGDLDLVLIRPLPALFYITLKKVKLLDVVRDGTIPLLIIGFIIDWSKFSISPMNVLFAIIVFISGQLAFHSFQFIVALTVFWTGESSSLYNITYEVWDINRVPFEGYNTWFRVIFTVFIPILLITPLTTSIILGKSNGLLFAGFAVFIAAIFLKIKSIVWKIGLKNYTSASS